MLLWLLILIIVVVILLIVTIYYYNSFVVLHNRIENAFSQIDVQLKKRNDLIPNLVETVKGYAKHEKTVFADVTKARKEMMVSGGSYESKMKASDMMSNALKSIFAIAENYPDLKANTNFLELQRELSDIESKIAYTRQFYNDSILYFNTIVERFPGNIFAGLFGKKKQTYFETSEAERKNVKVSFE